MLNGDDGRVLVVVGNGQAGDEKQHGGGESVEHRKASAVGSGKAGEGRRRQPEGTSRWAWPLTVIWRTSTIRTGDAASQSGSV